MLYLQNFVVFSLGEEICTVKKIIISLVNIAAWQLPTHALQIVVVFLVMLPLIPKLAEMILLFKSSIISEICVVGNSY